MADIQSNININVDTTNATAAIRNLQAQISAFHQQMQKSGSAANAATSANMQRNLINSVNATKKFSASMATVSTQTESFTNSLEKNKLSMGQYFRYAGASTRSFGRLFKSEFNTISQVAESRVRTLQTQYVKMGRDASGAMKALKVRPLSLDMQNLSTQTMVAAQKQQIFNQLLRQGSTNLLNFGKNTQWAGRQLMVGFTIPLGIMGMTAVKEFQKIEEQVIKLKRVYGDMFTTNAETDRAVEQVRMLAEEFTKYGIAVESTIGLAASVAQMGNVGADMVNQVTEATKLAVLGGMEQEKALDTTISLTNAFGIATEDLTDKINFLNAAENQTILAIDDFTEAVPKAGAVVAQLGGSVEDLAFFLTAMREGGVNASQAANALKSSLARLVNPTEKAQEDLRALGIDVLSIVEGNVGDLKGTIMDLGVALDELQPLQRSRALEELFGKFQFARMSTLFNNIAREGSQAQEILKLTGNTAAELQILADRELSRVEESPATKLQKQVEKLQAALAPIGAEFIKLVTPIVEFFTNLLKKFNEMDDGAKSFVTGLITVLGLIAPVAIMTFGLVANGIANLMKAFNAYRSFLQILSGSNRSVVTSTQYMTQEQLEAASVATNLGQAHQHLAQQFTVEASALEKLRAVYQAATLEMQRYNAASAVVPARAVRPPIARATGSRRASSPGGPLGFNKGTLNVPGPRGAGDIVPAVLSPGEAVIPARQSQKYSGFIEDIMNDQVPGMMFGGFASMFGMRGMLGRSRVATRMSSDAFRGSLRSGDLNYKSGFATGTGADFTDRMGRPMREHQLMRRQAEKKLYGTPLGSNDPSMRPTYGSVATTPLQRILNLIFGGRKGRQFNQVTNPMASNLDQYGDISLIGKRGMNQRASTFVGDTLLKYSKNPAWLKGTSPMKGATSSQLGTAGFDSFSKPFGTNRTADGGTSVNSAPSYIEAQTMGGFNYREIDKIVTRDPALRKQLKAELGAAGLGGVRVGGPGFVSNLLTKLGVPGFKNGIFSVPGPMGAGDVVPSMLSPGEAVIPADKAKKYRGFIKAMISDNIPGFEGGIADFASVDGNSSVMPSGRAIQSTNPRQASQLSSVINKLLEGFKMLGFSVEQAEQEILEMATAAEKNGKVTAKNFEAQSKGSGADIASNNTIAARRNAGRTPYVKGNEGAASLHMGAPQELTDIDRQELIKDLESKGYGDDAATRKLRSNPRAKVTSDATVIAPAIMNKSGKVTGKEASNIISSAPGMATADIAAASGLDSSDEVLRQAEQNMQMYLSEMGDEILTDTQVSDALRRAIVDAADSVKGESGKKVKQQLDNKRIIVGGRGTTKDKLARVGLPQGYNFTTSSGKNVTGPEQGAGTYLSRNTKTRFHEQAEGLTVQTAKNKPSMAMRSAAKPTRRASSPAKDASGDAKEYSNTFNNDVENKSKDPYQLARDNRNSPHPQAKKDGADDARAYNNSYRRASGSAGGPPPVPKPRRATAPAGPVSPNGVPIAPGYTSPVVQPANAATAADKSGKGFFSKFGEKARDAGSSLGRKAISTLENSSVGRKIGSQMAAAAGNTLTDSQGNIIYDANTGEQFDTQGNVVATGGTPPAPGQSGEVSQDVAIGPDGNPMVDKKGRPLSQKDATKQARKLASRQKRGMVAGRLGGAMGSASMMLGMSSMMPGMGDNPVMKAIQGFMPALFGLSAVIPLLAAMPLPITAVIAALGALAFGLYKYNADLKESREAGVELGNALTITSDKLIEMSKATGTVSATEARKRAQEDQVSGTSASQRQFGMNFMESDAGKSILSEIETIATSGLGLEEASESIGRQLSMAVYQGILSPEEANSVIAALGAEMDDYQFSADIQGQLISLIGPNGKDITEEPLDVALAIQESGADQVESFASMVETRLSQDFDLFDSLIDDADVSKKFEELSPEVQAEVKFRADLEQQYGDGGFGRIFAGFQGFLMDNAIFGGDLLRSSEGVYTQAKKFVEEASVLTDPVKLQSAAVQVGIGQVSENQQVLDALQAQFAQKEKALEADIDAEENAEKRKSLEAELTDLQAERKSAVSELNSANASTLGQIVEMRDLYKDTDAFAKAISTSVLAGFEDDDPLKILAEETVKQLENLEDSDFKTNIQLGFASGELSMSNVQSLLNAIETDPSVRMDFAVIVNDQGFAEASQLMTLLGMAGLEGEELTAAIRIFSFFDDPEEFSKNIAALTELAQLETEYGVKIDLEDENFEKKLKAGTDAIDALEDKPDVIKKTDLEIMNLPMFEGLLANWESMLGSSDTVTKTAILEYILMSKGIDNDLIERYRQEVLGGVPFAMVGLTDQQAMDRATAFYQKQGNKTEYEEDDPEDDGLGDDTGPVASALDSIVSKLRDVRDETIKATKGWTSSIEQLQKLFGGNKTIRIFDGLQQSLRSLGAGENLIELIVGMDPDEFERRKDQLFTIKGGQIVGLKDAAISIGDALNSIKVGEFQNSQEQIIADTANQEIALQKLTDAGLSLSEAYEIVADKALAAALATGQITGEEFDELIEKIDAASEAAERFDAIKKVSLDIESRNEEIRIQSFISGEFDPSVAEDALQIAAIISDEGLKGMIAAGEQGAEIFAERLQQITTSKSFLEKVFSQGFSNAMEAFNVKEQQVRLTVAAELEAGTFANSIYAEAEDLESVFGVDQLSDLLGISKDTVLDALSLVDPEAIVKASQAQIEAINFAIDDLDAELQLIQEEEEKINEEYDKRVEALEKVSEINDRIKRSQESQLGIASALSRGDIAAAAKAAQEARAEEAKARIEQEKSALEKKREAELSELRTKDGLTREQIETRIKDLKREIFNIEEDTLEPARLALSLSEMLLDKEIQSLTVLGKTKEAWTAIKNEVDLAKIASDEFVASMMAALGSYQDLIRAYNGETQPTPSRGSGSAPVAEEEEETKRINSSYTVVAEAQRAGNSNAEVLDRDTAAAAAYEAVHGSGVSGGDTTIKASSTLEFADKVQAKVLENRNAVRSGTLSDSQRSKLMNENIDLMQSSGLKFAVGGIVPRFGMGGKVSYKAGGGVLPSQASGAGRVGYFPMGGMIPYKASGGLFQSINTDTVPAMLTPGEFVVRRYAVDKYGVDKLKSINNGTYSGESVYNYNLSVNVKSDANPDDIARTVMTKIKQVDSQRMRGNRF